MRSRVFLFIFFVFIFTIFFIRGSVTQDPDFGWHIQAGNNIVSHGIPYTDPFSYSMPSYPFVDHEWLTNVLWALTFNKWGIMPLLIIMTFLAASSLLLQTIYNEKRWVGLLLFLAAGTLFDFVGVRTQVISWFFLSVLLLILFQKKIWEKWRYVLPVLFLLWANLHGSFGIGIGVLGIVLVGRALEEKKIVWQDFLLLGLCIGVTLINPFGVRLWWEFWMQLSDSQLHWVVAEWYPAIYFDNIAFWIYWTLSFFLILRYRKKFTYTELFLYFFLLLEAFISMRNIPIWIIASFALTVRGMSLLFQDAGKYKYGKDRFFRAYVVLCFAAFMMCLPQFGSFFYSLFVLKESENFYPAGAVAYLHKHLPKQQIFSTYDWGGYLIWRLPEKKVFIDGRMPSWRWQANIKGESNNAFDDYKNVLTSTIPFTTFAGKYHINTLLAPTAELSPPETKFLGITIQKNSPLQFLLISYKSFYTVVQEAQKAGWREVYHDQNAIIYEK